MRRYRRLNRRLCKNCIDRVFWEFTGKTLLFGWWGVISFFATLFILPNNIIRYLGTLGMSRPAYSGLPSSSGWRTLTVVIVIGLGLLCLFSLLTGANAPGAANEICHLRMTGSSVSLTIEGPNADDHCRKLAEEEGIYITNFPVQGDRVCEKRLFGQTYVVRDSDILGIEGSNMCRFLNEYQEQ